MHRVSVPVLLPGLRKRQCVAGTRGRGLLAVGAWRDALRWQMQVCVERRPPTLDALGQAASLRSPTRLTLASCLTILDTRSPELLGGAPWQCQS